MCLSKPPTPKLPDPVQDLKLPDLQGLRDARRKKAVAAGGTLLTGPSGVENAGSGAAKPTLLGQ